MHRTFATLGPVISRLSPAVLLTGFLAYGVANRFIQDDAFISFRYARNLVESGVLTWNVGDRIPVEGYTNFLWTLLMTIPLQLGLDVPRFSQMAGLLCGAGTLLLSYRLAHVSFGSRRIALLALLMLGTNYSFSSYMTGGLETSLQTLLLIAALNVYAGLRSEGISIPRLASLSLLFALMLLTRLDSVIPAGIITGAVLMLLVTGTPDQKTLARRMAAFCLPVAVVVGSWLAWKWQFYGDVLPNTFYVKAAGSSRRVAAAGLAYIGLFVGSYFLWPLLALVAVRVRSLLQDPISGLCLAITVLWLAYVIVVGGDFMEFRFLIPVLPLFFIIAAFALCRYRLVLVQVAVVISVLAGSMAHARHFAGANGVESITTLRAHLEGDCGWSAIGKRLRVLSEGGAEPVTIAVSAAGAIPYYSGLETIDMLGLNDRWIARHGIVVGDRPGHRRAGTVDYYNKASVNLVVGIFPVADEVFSEGAVHPIELFWMMLMGNPADLPPTVTMLKVPVNAHCNIPVLYLQPNRTVEQWIERGLVQGFPIAGISK